MKKSIMCVLAVFVLFTATSCSKEKKDETKIAVFVAPRGTTGFMDEAWLGGEKARDDFNIKIDFIEVASNNPADYETQGRFCAETKEYELLLFVGANVGDSVKLLATDFPDQNFSVVDAFVDGANVRSVRAKDPEQAFLSGVISGLVTTNKYRDAFPKSNDAQVIGYVGGANNPTSLSGAAGYIAGVKYVNPEVKVLYTILGSYTDPAGGKNIALNAIAQGADIVTGNCGSSIKGVLEACKDKDAYFIATSMSDTNSDYSLCTSVKKTDAFVYNECKSIVEKTWTPGDFRFGIAEGVCDVSLENIILSDTYPQEILAVVEKAREAVVAGTLVLPSDPAKIDEWAAANSYK